MTLRYGFYNSVNGDRTYDSEDFNRFFDGILTDGVIPGVGMEFLTTASGSSVTVGTGRAWFNKTWTYNDATESLVLPSTSTVNNRIDYLVLEVDTRSAFRENKLGFVSGEPSVNPSAPVLNPPVGVSYHPLYRIYRRRDINEVRAQDITKLIGTSASPYATNALASTQAWNNLAEKRNKVRGINLGSSFTTAQKNAIKDGSFEGLYLGDYWTYAGVRWRIVDFDYFLGLGGGVNNTLVTTANTTSIADHHVVLVPDDVRPLYDNQAPFIGTQKKTASNCGLEFSTRARTRLNDIAGRLGSMVGVNNLIAPRTFYPSTYVSSSQAMNRVVRFSRAPLMTELWLSGSRSLGLRYPTPHVDQFALYKTGGVRWFWDQYNVGGANETGSSWLAEQYNVDNWVTYQGWYGMTITNPRTHTNAQLRPALIVKGTA